MKYKELNEENEMQKTRYKHGDSKTMYGQQYPWSYMDSTRLVTKDQIMGWEEDFSDIYTTLIRSDSGSSLIWLYN